MLEFNLSFTNGVLLLVWNNWVQDNINQHGGPTEINYQPGKEQVESIFKVCERCFFFA